MPVIDLGSVVGPQGPQGATGATGAQGIQGNPGPNQVTDQTSTNLNGVLFGSQSRVTVKPVDSDPTADSTNLVSSGGVKTALDTKANQAQLAYVENGTTATNTNGYVVGEYFCWHGLLYRAKTAIGNGDTFTENTNCSQISRGGLNDISQNIIRGTVKFGSGEQKRDVFFNVTFLSPPTVVATFVGEKNAVRAQVANSSIYVDSTTTTSCKLTIDRTAQSAEVVVNYIAIGDIGLVRNAT